MKKKDFDCVQMKWDIQKQIEAESSGMTDSEANRLQMMKIKQNPILGPFLEKVRTVKTHEKTLQE
jgi:hypothetical protein